MSSDAPNTSEEQEDSAVPKHVIFVIHGINDLGKWGTMIETAFAEKAPSITVLPISYEYFPTWKFLSPAPMRAKFIKGPMETVAQQLRAAPGQFGHDVLISVIAHSFGSFVLCKVIEDCTDIKLHRVVLCGSVVSKKYPWKHVQHRIGGQETREFLINDCGNGDHWPMIGRLMGWGYGDIGTDGARTQYVTDRFHIGGHNLFLKTKKFVNRYWIPFFERGEIVQGNRRPREKLKWYWRLLWWMPFPRYTVPTLLLALTTCLLWTLLWLFGLSKTSPAYLCSRVQTAIQGKVLTPIAQSKAVSFDGKWIDTREELVDKHDCDFLYHILIDDLPSENDMSQIEVELKLDFAKRGDKIYFANDGEPSEVINRQKFDVRVGEDNKCEFVIGLTPGGSENRYPSPGFASNLLDLFHNELPIGWSDAQKQ